MVFEITEKQRSLMSDAELSVIDWLNSHEEQIPERSINEIADASFTSVATVSRTIKKYGFSGISELKYKVSTKLDSTVNEIFSRSLNECQRTIEALRVTDIIKVIDYIKSAEKIHIIAQGTTAWIANDFELQLQVLGYNAYLLDDSAIMKISKRLLKKDHLVIIFTVKNSQPELEMVARFAKENGAVVVLCCCIPGTSLEQYSDVSILGNGKNNSIIENFNIVSRLPLQIISRTLIDYLILQSEE